jgi:hypothetical protein
MAIRKDTSDENGAAHGRLHDLIQAGLGEEFGSYGAALSRCNYLMEPFPLPASCRGKHAATRFHASLGAGRYRPRAGLP